MNVYHSLAMAPQDGGGGAINIIFIGLIFVIFYFFLIRPQQKKQKEREKLLSSVKKGDKIVTVGGLHGTVVGLEDKQILVQVADNVKLKFEKTSVSTVLSTEGETK